MAEELTRELVRRAERGSPRGAAVVLAEAQRRVATDGERRPLLRSGPAYAVAAAAVTLIVVGGVLQATRLLVTDTSPIAAIPATAPLSSTTAATTAAPTTTAELLTFTGHTEGVSAVAWSLDGTHLATASRAIEGSDGIAKVWNAATGDELLSFHLGNSETVRVSMTYSPDGTRLAIVGPGAEVYDAATGDELLGLISGGFVAYSPDGSRIAVGGAWGWAAVLDAATGDEQFTLPKCASPYSWAWEAAWSPDGTRIARTCMASIKVSDVTTGDELLTIQSPFKVTDVAWSPDGTRIATASPNRWIAEVWDATTGNELVTLTGHTGEVWVVAWSPDGKRIATASHDGTAKIWDADSGDELASLTGHTAEVTDVAWSPDGTRIATASEDGTATIWKVD